MTTDHTARIARHRCHVQRENDDPCSEIQYVAMPPDPDGPWVKYSDVLDLLTAQQAARAQLLRSADLLTDAEARCEALTRERDEARAELAKNESAYRGLLLTSQELAGQAITDRERAEAAEARCAVLEVALERYGGHLQRCASNPTVTAGFRLVEGPDGELDTEDCSTRVVGVCDCGFEAALRPPTPEGQ